VLIVEIPPPEEVRQPAQDRSWAWQQVAPLVALFSMRTQAQRDRNTEQKVAFSELWRAATGSTIEFAEFPYGHLDAPLGWHLSRRERQDVDRAWRSYTADARPFQAIERVLGAPGQCGN
jgi:hypothetical protein